MMRTGEGLPPRSVRGWRLWFNYEVDEDDREDAERVRDLFVGFLKDKLGAAVVDAKPSRKLLPEWALAGAVEEAAENLRAADARKDVREMERWQNVLTELAEKSVALAQQLGGFDSQAAEVLRLALREAASAGAVGATARRVAEREGPVFRRRGRFGARRRFSPLRKSGGARVSEATSGPMTRRRWRSSRVSRRIPFATSVLGSRLTCCPPRSESGWSAPRRSRRPPARGSSCPLPSAPPRPGPCRDPR
jgi:hypothetical protein